MLIPTHSYPFLTLPAPLILGSQSPRRKQLLEALELPFQVIVRETDESAPKELTPMQTVQHIATQKANAFLDMKNDHMIITADTIVVLDTHILGKPIDENDAYHMLKLLAGRMHLVMTAVSILHKDKQVNFVETTKVHFREMSEKEIWHYIHHYKPLDKAGSYGAQEWAGMTVMTHIEGDFYNVMGLPVSRLFHHLYHWNND